MGHGFQKQIDHLKTESDALRAQGNAPMNVQNFYGDFGDIHIGEDGKYRASFKGAGEIVSSAPIEVRAVDRVGISDHVEAVLIPGDGKDDPPEG